MILHITKYLIITCLVVCIIITLSVDYNSINLNSDKYHSNLVGYNSKKSSSSINTRTKSGLMKIEYGKPFKQKLLVKRFRYIESDMNDSFRCYPKLPMISYEMVKVNEFLEIGKSINYKIENNQTISNLEISKLEELFKYFQIFEPSFKVKYPNTLVFD